MADLPKCAAVPGERKLPDPGDRGPDVRGVVFHSSPVLEGGTGRRWNPMLRKGKMAGEGNAPEIAIRGYIHDGESLYGAIRGRMEEAHPDGGQYIAQHATLGDRRRKRAAATGRERSVLPKILARLGFGYARRKK